MDTKTKFLELKKAWKKAGETERQQIEQETDLFLESLSDEEKKGVFEAIDEDFKAMHKEIEDIKQTISIRDVLAPVLPVISVSYLAKNYFRKTPQWFYQRMNGNRINGKSARFTVKEIETLNFAIRDISKKLSTVQF
jgi:hypothetical protein